ncbi:MAG: PA2779 family protein [Bdellovibrionales bacterium]|nr:PA2779 family protein [Bdellovibrionales bacterium]MCB0386315.1 PA2779 family protein [Bdellovibrionales bacterium]
MMRSSFVCLLCLSLALIFPPPAYGGLLTTNELVSGQASLAQQALQNLEDPEVLRELAQQGITPDEARQRIAGLTDDEIRRVIGGEYSQAGGDVVVTLLLVIIIILLIRR